MSKNRSKSGRSGNSKPPCRTCGGTGRVQQMKSSGKLRGKSGQLYETLKPEWVTCPDCR